MNIKKIVAGNTREALRQLKEQLGKDAVILSNRSVEGRVELLAVANDDMQSLVEFPSSFGRHTSPQFDRPLEDGWPDSERGSSPQLVEVMSELKSMRSSFETRLSEIAWDESSKRDPSRSLVLKEMLAAGFSAHLARFMTEKQPKVKEGEDPMVWIKQVLARNLSSLVDDEKLLDEGGVYALVGPTGVGKTTTTAKLAARCVMKHGPTKLALITTDSYRIGAVEQLRIYGKILSVMVHSIKDESDLKIALADMTNKHTILIDTVGMSQRDKMVAEQIAMLDNSGKKVKRLLCLNATSSGETLNEVIRSYTGNGLAGCILTKMDEAATIGGVLDILIKKKLPLFYISNGQRVPEDICLSNSTELIENAFKLKNDTTAFHLKDSELALIAGGINPDDDLSLKGIKLG